jgi:hypothetical protein
MPDPKKTSLVYAKRSNGTAYEVTSNYVGEVSFTNLLKQMLKRDLEKEKSRSNIRK